MEKARFQAEKAVSEIANRTCWKQGKRLDTQREAKDAKTSAALIGGPAPDIGIIISSMGKTSMVHGARFRRFESKYNGMQGRCAGRGHVSLAVAR